ncbi:MAG: L-serine ammonia-lyase, iron-sulfur-dependent, subunit alpha [Clostridia bacterium]|nr:L-serine ammonia-lyase, iron-sulfur-dependent, subunit alpha [Clostridia bacterium]
MKTILEIYKTGRGPSSSHTIGPERAVRIFLQKYPATESAIVTLYGSLAKTGKGHLTDKVIRETFGAVECEVVFDTKTALTTHPNTLRIVGFAGGKECARAEVQSIGGGDILFDGEQPAALPDIYEHSTFSQIKTACTLQEIGLWEYIVQREGADLEEALARIWEQMKRSVAEGLANEGTIPGPLALQRKAAYLLRQKKDDESKETRENRLVCAYAFAVAEQNACAGEVVTAPTCGAAGVLASVLYYMQQRKNLSDSDIIRALGVAGLIGQIIKTNASVSGAECGCQAEIGSACSMAAAALSQLRSMDIDQTEYAAEIAMEHHLGLTCDPVGGLVQIPCIERNAVAAMRAINAVKLASLLQGTRRISFDAVVETMYRTGMDMNARYRETAEGGLASIQGL